MRYLMAVWDGGGATPPNLGIARMLRERGHDVVVYGDPTLAADIVATGAEHRPWPTAPQRISTALDDDVLKDWEPRTPIGQMLRLVDRLMAGDAAPRFASDVAAALDAAAVGGQPFDVVLADGILLGALVAAEARGTPSAALAGSTYLAPSPVRPPTGSIPPARGPLGRFRDRCCYRLTTALGTRGVPSLNGTRAAYGLPPLKLLWDQWDRADRVLMLTSSAFDDPPPDAANVRYTGPVLDDIPAAGTFALPPGDDPLITVGMSSSYMQQGDLLRRVAAALATLPVRAVITTGPAIDPAEVPGAPNVAVVQAVPHGELIPPSALVITHAGHGTLIKSLAAGVPVLCLPLGRDQPGNAARAARHGVASVLSPRADAGRIAAAVERMLGDPSYRAAAAALGERIRAEVASGALLRELELLPEPGVSR